MPPNFCKGDTTEVGLGGSVVTRLTRDLVRKSYHMFFPPRLCIVTYSKRIFIVLVPYVVTDATSLLTSRM